MKMVTQTARPVGRPREFDEEAVLAAAMEAFWRKGYEATSLVDLTEATGLNKASLYRVFGDKHQLFMAALKNYADVEFRESAAVMSDSATPLENLRAIIAKVSEDNGTDKGCLMINSMVETAPHDPEVSQLLRSFGQQRQQALQELITAAQAAGEIRAELDPARLTCSLMVTFAGSAALAKGFMPNIQLMANIEYLIDSWT